MASARKKGAVLSYIFMILEIFSGMFFTPFLIRSFGQAEYGVYSLVSSVTSYLYLLDLGVGNSIIRYMSKYRVNRDTDKQRALMTATLGFYMGVGLLIIIIGLILCGNFGIIFGKGLSPEQIDRAQIMFSVTMLNAAVTLMLAPFNKTILAYERFTFSKTADIIKIFVRVGISFAVLRLGGRGISIVIVNFIMTLLFGAASIIYNVVSIKIYPALKRVERSFIKEIFSYSAVVCVQMIATQLNSMVDQLLMGIMVKSSAVIIGVYAIGAQISTYYQSFASSVNGVLMPGVVRMVETTENPKVIENEMVKIGRLLFMMLGIIYMVFVIFGDDFIKLWAGEDNYEAYYVAVIIMIPMPLVLSQSIGAQVLWAMNRHKIQAVMQICIALSNVIFTAIMIQWNPLLGASIATGITYFIGNIVVYNFVFRKYIGISMLSYYRSLFKGIIPCLVASTVVGLTIQMMRLGGWSGFIANCFVMSVVYLALMLWKGMNAYEKDLVKSIVSKFNGGKRHV